MKRITVTVGTVTFAMKARKLLARKGIASQVVRVNSSDMGCIHGLEFKETDMFGVASTLKENGIPYSVYSRNGLP